MSRVVVDGLSELRRFLRAMPDELAAQGLAEIHKKVAEPVRVESLSLVPRRSGRLADSIRVAERSKTKAVIRAGKARVPYAGPIHYGWPARNIRPQPFLTDALENRRQEVADIYTDELDRFIGWAMTKAGLRP